MMSAHESPVLFREVQRFHWLFVLLVLLVVLASVGGVFGHGLIKQLARGEPWGDRPLSDTALVLASLSAVGIAGGIGLLFALLQLVVEVRADGVFIRYYPLLRRTIAYHDIRSCAAVTYRPLLDYGGWGVRWRPRGMAYNVSGNRGVRLELANGKHVLIGSRRAEELAQVIRQCMNRRNPAA